MMKYVLLQTTKKLVLYIQMNALGVFSAYVFFPTNVPKFKAESPTKVNLKWNPKTEIWKYRNREWQRESYSRLLKTAQVFTASFDVIAAQVDSTAEFRY